MVLFVTMGLSVVPLLLGMPVAFAIGVGSLSGLLLMGDVPLSLVAQRMFKGVESFPLLAVPFFILAGEIMREGKITDGLVDFATLLVGRIRGGLSQVNIVGSMLFAGVTGSAVADTSAIGSVMIPAMIKEGYGRGFSAAITAASSVIGPIIPPSLTMVIYSYVTGVSVGGLFMAGIVPGVLVGLALMFQCFVISQKRNYPKKTVNYSFSQAINIFKNTIFALIVPIIILGGILSGVFTATESAVVAVVYSFVVCILILRTVAAKGLYKIFLNTAKITSVVLLLVATTNIMAWILTVERVPQYTMNVIKSISENPYVFLLLVNIIFLLAGTFLDTIPAIFILTPIFEPVAIGFGIHPLHFGLIVVVNLLIGLITPPVGSCLYVACPLAKISMEDLVKSIWPFLVTEIAVLLLITYVPDISMYIPKKMGYY